MTQRRSYAVGTGLFIVLGFAALAYLATQTTSVANTRGGDTYTVETRFANVGQLKVRAPVKVAGVRVGSVQAIDLVPGKEEAKVTLAIDDNHKDIPEDSVATIYTSGLLGDQYVGIQFGQSKNPVKEGGEIGLTRPAQQLEEMLGKFFGGGSAPDRLGGTFHVTGSFTNIGGLQPGAAVKMAGVPIGSVESVVVKPGAVEATVTLAIDKRYSQIPDDSSAAVFTSGLIGSQYVAIQPGGSPEYLADGDSFVLTQSALQLEDLIGKFLVNGSPSENKSGGAQGAAPSDNAGKK
ncbi:outer membrane lipid asymmetry maintenance protein MlaD [Luteibacter yeojuensis]|uniref:Outer membrane lipid asymmetry maintenance protein MlaD n=1 Tax=Luteibacter yeojuensis TaxID=345309 RepID=A0A7X5TS87_9GAMM|nr:outer membrane lipid asymmetry maintenance protein MlaD [Luteibacter yeojuensis]